MISTVAVTVSQSRDLVNHDRLLTRCGGLRDCYAMSSFIALNSAELFSMFDNPIFLSSLSSWFLAQLLKAIILILKTAHKSAKGIALTLLWKTGGMPSSHSSLVAALATSVGFREGLDSNLFIVSLCLALIVIRDSLGVRRSSGLQARSLNKLGKDVASRLDIDYVPVKEIQGHAPLEVIVGALIGFFIAVAFAVL